MKNLKTIIASLLGLAALVFGWFAYMKKKATNMKEKKGFALFLTLTIVPVVLIPVIIWWDKIKDWFSKMKAQNKP